MSHPTEKEAAVYRKALEKWGNQAQIFVAIEELSELQKALCKLVRPDEGPISDVIEEIADVEIMLDQLKVMLDIRFYEIAVQKQRKFERLEEMLDV